MIASSDNSTVSRDNSTVSRDYSTVSRDDSTKHLPKWRQNLLKLHGEHCIINSVQNDKRTGTTGRHCFGQRYRPMRTRLIIEVLIDPQGSVDLYFTSNDDPVPTRCILDVDEYNNMYPRFKLSDIVSCYFSGSETAWQRCATFVDEPAVVEDFYDTAVIESETVAVFELELWQLTAKYFIPAGCDSRFSFLSRLRRLLSV